MIVRPPRMRPGQPVAGSIRRQLVVQLLLVAGVLAALLYVSVRTVAGTAVETTQDNVLGAATIAIAEELRGGEDGVAVDIPYTAFSMLGSVGQDRVFYRIVIAGETVTGYPDLPVPDAPIPPFDPRYYSRPFQDTVVRLAAVERSVLVAGRPVPVLVVVAQTRTSQDAIVAQMANRAAALGLGFFAVAALLSLFTARSVLAPVQRLAEAVGRRGPQDLRPVARPVPAELAPLVGALNGFIARLSGALSRTETFITEAAHHIRTPLATLRAQAEVALLQTREEATRATLRTMIRAVDDSARSAGQLLDHAAVVYRSDQRTEGVVDLGALAADIVHSYAPTAEMRDIALVLEAADPAPRLTADRLLLESALRNLVDNAIKYSPADATVTVQVQAVPGHAVVRVMDRGRGLAGQVQADVMGRFRRGANVADVVGSGLGLTIVKDVARAMGGTFTIQERNGGGVCAELSLPLV